VARAKKEKPGMPRNRRNLAKNLKRILENEKVLKKLKAENEAH
jgi:hypothetical protein